MVVAITSAAVGAVGICTHPLFNLRYATITASIAFVIIHTFSFIVQQMVSACEHSCSPLTMYRNLNVYHAILGGIGHLLLLPLRVVEIMFKDTVEYIIRTILMIIIMAAFVMLLVQLYKLSPLVTGIATNILVIGVAMLYVNA